MQEQAGFFSRVAQIASPLQSEHRYKIQRDEEETENSQGEEDENWEPAPMGFQEELDVDFHVTLKDLKLSEDELVF